MTVTDADSLPGEQCRPEPQFDPSGRNNPLWLLRLGQAPGNAPRQSGLRPPTSGRDPFGVTPTALTPAVRNQAAPETVPSAGYAHIVPLHDTSPDIRRRQLDAYRAMEPGQRAELAVMMSEQIREITLDGIRLRNPRFDEGRVHHQWLRILHGDELARQLATRFSTR